MTCLGIMHSESVASRFMIEEETLRIPKLLNFMWHFGRCSNGDRATAKTNRQIRDEIS